MVGRESWAAASFFLVVRRLVSISGGGDGRAEFIVIVIVFRPPVGVHLDGDGGRIRMLLLAIIVLLFVAFALLLFVVVDLAEAAVVGKVEGGVILVVVRAGSDDAWSHGDSIMVGRRIHDNKGMGPPPQ